MPSSSVIYFKFHMDICYFAVLILSVLLLLTPFSVSTPPSSLTKDSSLSVENPDDVLISPNNKFSAGFYSVGFNAYYFAIWFNEPFCSTNCTLVWMANRDFPVNGKRSKLSLLKTGNLTLTDAGQTVVWATNKISNSSVQLSLNDTGNLVLSDEEGFTLWQSCDSPADTLLPQQPLTRNIQLISSRSQANFSSGFYKLFFDYDNVLRLAFEGPETSSIYWPDPTVLDYQAGRSRYNDTRIAVFNTKGYFKSSDHEEFWSADFGTGPQRRLTLDFDGNLRLYSFQEEKGHWSVTWQALPEPCKIHGSCGPNSVCHYRPEFGRKCSCPQGFKLKNPRDWGYGCEPEIKLSCNNSNEVSFVEIHSTEFYGYDFNVKKNSTLEMCKKTCLELCDCKGFQYQPIAKNKDYNCYPKRELRNGYRSPNYNGTLFLKFAKSEISSFKESLVELHLNCSDPHVKQLSRSYRKIGGNGSWKILLLCASVIGCIELISFFLVFIFLNKNRQDSDPVSRGYLAIATRFQRFTYAELKKATKSFSQEIGRGGAGTVYKGVLPDQRIAAIKRLTEANQGEEEFRTEVSTIGKLNHMNLIDMWGFCAEGKHRLLVYEYMENGSLADALLSNSLDWSTSFAIALGTAKGLAYLHEECLEWVLHCDVKPQNILLDSNYMPKVADFGLSKILNRAGTNNSSFSRIRGTRGYMAPEWVFNLPITSKVDVYSYGIVLLEMVTGKFSAMCGNVADDNRGEAEHKKLVISAMGDDAVDESRGEAEHKRLVAWVRETKNRASGKKCWVKEIVDPVLGNEYDYNQMETLIGIALQCVDEDRDARPSMSQVVEMLLRHEVDH